MTELTFSKMHALGNDFVVIDELQQPILFHPQWAKLLADRHTGVGCDQILVLSPPKRSQDDFFYHIYNPDGSLAGQCGNGARCLGLYIHQHQLSPKRQWRIQTSTTTVYIQMDPKTKAVKVNLGEPQIIHTQQTLVVDDLNAEFMTLSLGNPHIVLKPMDLTALQHAPIERWGVALSTHPSFPEGTNVSFIAMINAHTLAVRVYERGAGQTQACGSAAAASAICARLQGLIRTDLIEIQMPGGVLQVSWKGRSTDDVWLLGPTHAVYQGRIRLP
jgi:diaminopimelate epimerase